MRFLAEAPRLEVQVLELVVVAGGPVRGRGGRGWRGWRGGILRRWCGGMGSTGARLAGC